jgi:ABC-type antimicrobial peptide transport system permease subunit
LLLPVLVVASALYPGCRIAESGSSCQFWGVAMGDTFSTAAAAPWMVYIIPPVGFAAALTVMLIAFIVKRQRV